MKIIQKIFVGISVVALVVASWALNIASHVKSNVTEIKSYGATGDTYAVQPMSSIGFNTATVTPASLFNGSGRDRVVTKVFLTANTPNVYGTSTIYNILAATSTNQYNQLSTGGSQNTNYVYNITGAFSSPVAGSGGDFSTASSTLANVGQGNGTNAGSLIRWPNGTYLNFMIGSSTNTLTATNYVYTNGKGATNNNDAALGSTTSGFAGVEYYPQ